jgi:hypothetical protein
LGTTPPVTATVETIFPGTVQILLLNTEYATVPPAWKLPLRVAESETALPIVIDVEESKVVKVGLVLLTVRGSHALLVLTLLVSPLYVALNAKDPADAGVTEAEGGTELPEPTVTIEIDAGVPVQRPLLKKA